MEERLEGYDGREYCEGQEEHGCADGFDSVWVLWKVVDLPCMHVQNAQLGYIVDKSLNHQWFENFCSVQEEWGRH